MKLIGEIISNHLLKNAVAINKSELTKQIKESELIELSQQETKNALKNGEGEYWNSRRDKSDNNKLLFYPLNT